MIARFSHEDLIVYQKALAFCASVFDMVDDWDAKHAVTDHLPRAAESIVENLAEASAAYSGVKQTHLEYSLGSTLECAACLDVAQIKGLSTSARTDSMKGELLHIFRMLVGLWKSWSALREETASYAAGADAPHKREGFHHEQLDVYKAALAVVQWTANAEFVAAFPVKIFRRVDGLATGIVLNLAEGNGRFSGLDQRRFVELSHRLALKLAAHIDLCLHKRLIDSAASRDAKKRILPVVRMTAGMIGQAGRKGSRAQDEAQDEVQDEEQDEEQL